MAQIDICNTPTELNLRFLKNICCLVKWPLPSPLFGGWEGWLVRGYEGKRPVAGPVVTPGAGNDAAKLSRPGCAGLWWRLTERVQQDAAR